MLKFIYNDGGRSKYFNTNSVGDCGVRAVANATGLDYKQVYDSLFELAKEYNAKRNKKNRKKDVSPRNGVDKKVFKKFMEEHIGWEWTPTMRIGTGCTVNLSEDCLPEGDLIISVSKHLTCVKNGVLYDTYDCSREGERCVYGYWRKPDDWTIDLVE